MIPSAGLRAAVSSSPIFTLGGLPSSRIATSSVIHGLAQNGLCQSRTLTPRTVLYASKALVGCNVYSIVGRRQVEGVRFASTTSGSSLHRSPSIPTATSQSNANIKPEPDADPDPESDAPPPGSSAYTRFKLLAKKYGWYAFGMYWILSTIDFSLTYLVVHSMGSERIEPLIGSSLHAYRTWRHGEQGTLELEEEDRKRRQEAKAELEGPGGKKAGYIGSRMFWAEVALAYTIHKIALLPFRAGLTVAWTPKVVRWLQARGWAGKVSRGFSICVFSRTMHR